MAAEPEGEYGGRGERRTETESETKQQKKYFQKQGNTSPSLRTFMVGLVPTAAQGLPYQTDTSHFPEA